MPTKESAIYLGNLTKCFSVPQRHEGRFATLRSLLKPIKEQRAVVQGLSMSIAQGEMVALLGPNGAGKSTTVKMLTGILVPTSGDVRVGGLVPWRNRHLNAKQIGVVFGQRSQLWWDLPLRDSLRLIGRLYEVPDAVWQEQLRRFSELLDMAEFMDTPIRQLSLGQRMRGDLAAAMLYEPKILFLDEPTVGLDIVAREAIRGFIEEVNYQQGTTVVLTTHDLDDVERLCRRAILIDHGRALYDGSLEVLKSRYTPHRELLIQLAVPGDLVVPDAEQVERGEAGVRLRFDPTAVSAAELIGRVLADYQVTDLSIVEPTLDSVIHEIYASRSVVPA